jgi:RNA polymerase sigma-70 factor, ECF subfamily
VAKSRAFFAAASQAIRRILVEHARKHRAIKRSGGGLRIALDEASQVTREPDIDVLAVHEALTNLSSFDPRMGHVVELRFFGGLSIDETAGVLGMSKRTIENDWTMARAWLRRALAEADEQ